MVTAFDTLQFADRLKDAGTPVAQAEATARLLGEALAAERAAWPTRADLARSDARRELLFGAVDQRFGAVDQHFDSVAQRFDVVDQRFDAVAQGFDAVAQRFEKVEQRLDRVEQLLGKVEQRLDKVEQQLAKLVTDVAVLGTRIDAVHADTRWIKGMLATQFAGMMALLVGMVWLLQRAVG
ncbi:hemolysin XhlA [mine drainage metagenome]|jgi:DNA repair ATPase RecN|uniref:Hemolysin XhlA n=1 Tax=mine drainage metagenome TaxID=410659 RepID=A0A1J5Q9W3_9ZZZZ